MTEAQEVWADFGNNRNDVALTTYTDRPNFDYHDDAGRILVCQPAVEIHGRADIVC